MILGAHCSGGVKGSLDRAVAIGADAVQLFVQSPRAWRFPEHDPAALERFRERRAELGIGSVLVHAIYLVNLASPKDDFYEKSVSVMRSTVDTACAIGADGVVFHLGSHLGAGFEAGLARAVPALEQVVERCSGETWLLLENSAGTGGTMGRSVEELATIVDRLDRHPRLGVCLDSCHLWVSGYDVGDPDAMAALVAEVDARIGLDRLRALHVNDSLDGLGANRDRHANLGEGVIGKGLVGFLAEPAFAGLPAVLEVPGLDGHGPGATDVRRLRDFARRARRRGRSARRPAARGTRG